MPTSTGYRRDLFSNVDSWDVFKKLTYFSKIGLGRKPGIKPKSLDAPTAVQHAKILDAQFAKATSDYYTRLTIVDPDRLRSYDDFDAMDYTPEISSALDIYSDESLTLDEQDRMLVIDCSNERIRQELEILFNDVLDVKSNLWSWTRNVCKYGNHYLLLDVNDKSGVVGHMSLPVREITREEAYDGNLNSVKFRWEMIGESFDAWQVAHFRLLGTDLNYPYGTSMLESSRRIWKQLQLAEDAMIVYRITRAPERRVFRIDVGNINPNDIPKYIDEIKRTVKRAPEINHHTGTVDFKYNPMAVDEDFFIPVRGDKSSNIDTLPGASNLDEIADIEYLQGKLFSALKIPKAFLSYEEDINAKATLAGQDSRFARTINRIQLAIISELVKIALVHLYTIGYRDRDQLRSFKLKLTNPNKLIIQENLEILQNRGNVFGALWNDTTLSPISLVWGLRNVMNFSEQEIRAILKQQFLEGKMNLQISTQSDPSLKDGGVGGLGDSGFGDEASSSNQNPVSESVIEERISRMLELLDTCETNTYDQLSSLLTSNDKLSEANMKLLSTIDTDKSYSSVRKAAAAK